MLGRELPNGRVAFANFLVDTYCAGVKDVIFKSVSSEEYDTKVVDRIRSKLGLDSFSPSAARKLIEGAIAYARSFGLEPHRDDAKAQAVFGDIDPTATRRVFKYGRNGRPVYVPGPYDTPETAAGVLRAIEGRSGGALAFDRIVFIE